MCNSGCLTSSRVRVEIAWKWRSTIVEDLPILRAILFIPEIVGFLEHYFWVNHAKKYLSIAISFRDIDPPKLSLIRSSLSLIHVFQYEKSNTNINMEIYDCLSRTNRKRFLLDTPVYKYIIDIWWWFIYSWSVAKAISVLESINVLKAETGITFGHDLGIVLKNCPELMTTHPEGKFRIFIMRFYTGVQFRQSTRRFKKKS